MKEHAALKMKQQTQKELFAKKKEQIEARKKQIETLKNKIDKTKKENEVLSEKVKKHLPVSSPHGLEELKKDLGDQQMKLEERKADKMGLEKKRNQIQELMDNCYITITKLRSKIRKYVQENNSEIFELSLVYPELRECLISEENQIKVPDLETLQEVYNKRKELLSKCLETKAKIKEDKKKLQQQIQQVIYLLGCTKILLALKLFFMFYLFSTFHIAPSALKTVTLY